MAMYTLYVLSCHQQDLIFILFLIDHEKYIEYCLIRSNIMTIA